MRLNLCCTILHVCIWTELLLTLNADDECYIETRVHENTSYKAVVGEQLKIECGVAFCEEAPPTVDWFKREKTAAAAVNCKSEDSRSHYINVFVHGSTHPEPTVNSWTYMYFAAGIVPFIIIVIIISVVSMRGCKGKSKKETSRENQYMAIPMVEQPLHHGRLQPSPRGSPSAPPCRRSLRTKTPPLQPNELPLPRDNYPVYRVKTRDGERQRNTAEEEGSSIVYAALNHQLPARAARPPRPTEEQSEYAAIRVKE
ncbi:hypothetical protein JOQ06_000667 [Pogonophryne albipinna]|uniref:Ig-like domain-containing protein n=1 Tax=Pogonophryne albipinna TaxID=1090488 RepID=A0AAD6AGM3_9TELE|nr:hypothetical protein JOQ06_000667 [Pogonophryne albipinna]